jgi:hypothetical protein
VQLARTDENVAQITALAERLGGRPGLGALRADLTRRAHRAVAPGRSVRHALTWDAFDRSDPAWMPQGIAAYDGLLLVSWYGEHGSRVSVLDPVTRRYRHVLLAVPTDDGGLAPLRVHAGGLATYGRFLHVAATRAGVHVCSLDDLLRVPRVGLVASYGYRWVLPVRFTYAARGAAFRYSFLAGEEDGLLAGEYDAKGGRLARFAADPATGLLGASDATVLDAGVPRAQGATIVDGRWYLTASHGTRTPGSVWVGAPGALREVRWATPPGPEDLAWERERDLLWSVSEHPHRRWVFAMRRASLDRR